MLTLVEISSHTPGVFTTGRNSDHFESNFLILDHMSWRVSVYAMVETQRDRTLDCAEMQVAGLVGKAGT